MALEVIAQVRQAHPEVALREVDLAAHPKVAVRYGVLSTPAIAINGELAWAGIPSAQALGVAKADVERIMGGNMARLSRLAW